MKPNSHGSLSRIGLQCFLAAVLAACGGGGDSGPSGTAPSISNLQYSPQAAYASAASAMFTGQLAFSDPDGDVSSTTLTIVNSGGATVSTTAIPIQGAAGATSGVIQGSVVASLAVADNYTMQVFVTDARGLRSNTLSGPVRIAQFPWTSKLASSTAREYAAAVTLNERVYVVGGQRTDAGTVPGPVTGVVEAYDPKTNTWAAVPSMPTARQAWRLPSHSESCMR
jgi:N-acetylneuraminic acid mutarotase